MCASEGTHRHAVAEPCRRFPPPRAFPLLTGTSVCEGAMQKVWRRYGDPGPGGVRQAVTPPFRIWRAPRHARSTGSARLLPRLIAGRTPRTAVPHRPCPCPGPRPAVVDRCPDTGRGRLWYRRAEALFRQASADGRCISSATRREPAVVDGQEPPHQPAVAAALRPPRSRSRRGAHPSPTNFLQPSTPSATESMDTNLSRVRVGHCVQKVIMSVCSAFSPAATLAMYASVYSATR